MPELPEVETAMRYVDQQAIGSKVRRVKVLDLRMLDRDSPTDLNDLLKGRCLQGTGRHGKNLFLCFDHGVLHIHLGMSGSVLFDEDVHRHSSHERLRLDLDCGVLILDDPRRFGRFGWFPNMADFVARKGLGPDALTIADQEFVERMRARKGAIKAVLLDQRVVAGLGNLYVDEVLFQGRIHPRTPASTVPEHDLTRLCQLVREVLEASIAARTDFEKLPPGYLLRQREKRGVCPRCGIELAATVVGGRTTIFCPECQDRSAVL